MRRRLGVVLASAALVLFSFQNCGRSNFATNEDDTILGSSGVDLPKSTSPIAFEVGLDAIAYNSCVPNNRTAEAYFTLKASAGGTRGGARLAPEFLTTASSQLKPILGNADVLDVQYKQLLEQTHPELEAQIALRSTTDYNAAFLGKSSVGVWGRMNMLSHDSWLTPLVESGRRKNNQWVPYSARAPSSQARMDYSFTQDLGNDYWNGLASIQGFRTCVQQGCQGYGRFAITAGFSEPADKSKIRGPSTSATQISAYGRGYLLQFGYPDNRTEAGMRVVKNVQEYNLQNQTPIIENNAATQWKCTEIPIMSSVQRGPAGNPQTSALDRIKTNTSTTREPLCNPMQGSYVATYYQQLNIAKIRELLPSHQWQLGFQNTASGSRLCAIPIGFDCYPNEPFPNIQANGSQQPYPYYVSYKPGTTGDEVCINEDNMGTELAKVGAEAVNRVCAHYITVCTKQ